MRSWERAATGTAVLVVAASAARIAARAVWRRRTDAALERLDSVRQTDIPSRPPVFSPAELSGLPAPVARFFVYALAPGQPIVSRCRLGQQGEFATQPGRWTPFEATEHFMASPPAFLWDARIRAVPGVDVLVRDSYVAGEGSMRGAVEGVFPVIADAGTPEMASASLLRYLAEAVWFPTALLPGDGVTWHSIDDDSARVTLHDSGISVSMDVSFEPTGAISRVSALRHRSLDGTPVVTPWEGRFGPGVRRAGMMVPSTGEVGWIIAGEWQPYWRGRMTEYEVEYAPA